MVREAVEIEKKRESEVAFLTKKNNSWVCRECGCPEEVKDG